MGVKVGCAPMNVSIQGIQLNHLKGGDLAEVAAGAAFSVLVHELGHLAILERENVGHHEGLLAKRRLRRPPGFVDS